MNEDIRTDLAQRLAWYITENGRLEERVRRLQDVSNGKEYKLARQQQDLARLYDELKKLKAQPPGINLETEKAIQNAMQVKYEQEKKHKEHVNAQKAALYDLQLALMHSLPGSQNFEDLEMRLKATAAWVESLERDA